MSSTWRGAPTVGTSSCCATTWPRSNADGRDRRMTQPLIVSIPHRLGKAEAVRRLKTGMGRARTDFSTLISIDEETWNGDAVTFRLRTLGQGAAGTIHVHDDQLRLEIV